MNKNQPSVGSMFAGIGGFDLGFERAGFRVAWCIEFNKHAQAVLRKRFPLAKIYGDIREVDPLTLESVDVICGGFPCQDVSVAGKRAGLAGGRTGLFFDAIRIVRQLQPRLLILENVVGMLSSNNGLDFAAVLREVGEGWNCEEVAWRVLDSQYFGVAQRRNRVFIVGGVAAGHAEKILAFGESVCRNPPPRRKAGQDAAADPQASSTASCRGYGGSSQSVSDTVTSKRHKGSGGPAGSECGLFVAEIPMYQEVVGPLLAVDYKGINNQYVHAEKVIVTPNTLSPVAAAFRKSRRAQSSTDCETWVDDGLANTLNGFDTGDTRTTHAVCAIPIHDQATRWAGKNGEKSDGKGNGFGIGKDGDPSPTLTQGDKHAVAVIPFCINMGGDRGGASVSRGNMSYTLTTNEPHAVGIFPIDLRNATRNADKLDAQNRQGCGIGNEGDPSPTLLGHHTPTVALTARESGQGYWMQDSISGTLRAEGENRPSRPSNVICNTSMVVRRLTPVECERLQGFPDGWTDIGTAEKPTSDGNRYKQLGNAVTVNVAEWLARRAMDCLQ
jgi:DNA (cytosine-5)-methyltransferase 1